LLTPELEVTIHIEPIDDGASWEAAELAKLSEPTAPSAVPVTLPPIDD
jgi:hypothetical protein